MIDPNQNVLPAPPVQPQPSIVATALPLPAGAGLGFWKSEIERSEREQGKHHKNWQDNIAWYRGDAPDAYKDGNPDYVNVNIDFSRVEQKGPQLFYETPELQMTGTGILKGRDDIAQAHRSLLDEILDEIKVLTRAVQPAIKDCLCTAGVGPVIIGYQPTNRTAQPPDQPGSILGLVGPIDVPLYKQFYIQRFSPKKLLIPADFTSTDWDLAPWLGMRFRMPLSVAQREFAAAFAAQPDFRGTKDRDEYILDDKEKATEASGVPYVDGVLIFYRAAQIDPAAVHPELYRELVIIDGLEKEARHRDSPHQTILPNGQLTGDSMIGNPIAPLSIRDVPDSAYTPSDTHMIRPLVRELCKFRTQMVQERDANRPFNLYETEKLPPEVIAKIENRTVGSLIGVESLAGGPQSIMAPAITGQAPRQTYIQNDYIQHDIDQSLAIDTTGSGVTEDDNETATKTAEVSRARNVRLDGERRQVLLWYLGVIDKFSALVCRYLNPAEAQRYIGQDAAVWAQWDKKAVDQRLAFDAKPDSQIRLDAASERRFALQVYQMCANDPNVSRVELLKRLFALSGIDPAKAVVEQLPQKPPEEKFSFAFKGEDLIGPQAPMVLEILAQGGIQISQQAADQAAGLMFKQVALGLRDASGRPVPQASKQPAEHGGPAEQVRPLSKRQGDETGNRPGPKSEAA